MSGGREAGRAAAVFFWLAGALAAPAAVLYSVNVDTDELVLVNTDTGAVQVVGPTGHDMRDVDLAYFNGLIVGINNNFGSPAHLFVLDPQTGAAFAYVPIRLVSNTIITNAKGLAAHAGRLVASFDTPDTQGDPLKCNGLGELGLSGFVTNIFDYSVLNTAADMEGLGTRADGQLFSVDNLTPGAARLFRVGRNPPSYSSFADVPAMDDIEFTSDRLFGLQNGRGLYELNPLTGALIKPEPVYPNVRLSGLAIPEPAAALLLLVGVAARRR